MEYQSPEIDQLMAALMLVHAEFGVVLEKDKKGHKGNYASLPLVLDSIHKMNKKHGLILTQGSRFFEGNHALETKLYHPMSKQWISCCSFLTPSNSPNVDQAWGATTTYHRRYDAMMLMGIFASDDPADNDGEPEYINASQLGLLKIKLKDQPGREEKLLKAYGLSDLRYLPKNEMNDVMRVLDTTTKG